MEFFILFCVCAWVVLWGVVGRICASARGINPVGGFLGGLFLGPLALLILLCKPMK